MGGFQLEIKFTFTPKLHSHIKILGQIIITVGYSLTQSAGLVGWWNVFLSLSLGGWSLKGTSLAPTSPVDDVTKLTKDLQGLIFDKLY